ncbi:F-box only protein 33 [Anabrus simplex]|uniref:F-box only protein 33 n=1 Tax=Anabrus simplex TaxID=316456 RepID=UPI0035A34148
MASEDGSWSNLPSVILVEIFSYLSHSDKISAASTCKYWRCALFHPSFWQTIHFKAKTKDRNSILRTRYLSSFFSKKLRNTTVSFDSMDPLCVQEAARVIQKLCDNDHLRRLFLFPSHCRLECPGKEGDGRQFFERHLLKPLQMLVRQCRKLEALSLGCSEDFACYAGRVLDLLARYQAGSLRYLKLASLKDDPDDYLLLDLDPAVFRSFHMLQVLSLDYDYVSDSLLGVLCNLGLKRFIIHVHGIVESHPGTTNAAWTAFSQRSPQCEIHLTLIHSYEAVNVLHSEILRPSMNLTHLKAFFCEKLNCRALQCLSDWYTQSLRSLWWVDSMSSPACYCLVQQYILDEQMQPDPLVILAWKCTNLQEIVLLGYKYLDENLIAIARLRGTTLKRLDIAVQDILFESEDTSRENELLLEVKVSESIGKTWAPLADAQLHDVIHNPTAGDSDEFILPVVLQDQDL